MTRGLLTFLLIAGIATSAEASQIKTLEHLVVQHPDDADRLFALAQALEAEGRLEDAAQELRHYLRRWPNRRADVYLSLGKIQFNQRKYEDALETIEDGLVRNPVDGAARMYRGLCLRELGRHKEAARELRIASHLEPDLKSETLFLRALSQMETGNDNEGERLLREVIKLDPASENSRRAELLLGSPSGSTTPSDIPSASTKRKLNLSVYTGTERDTNVTLDGSGGLTASTTDQKDTRYIVGSGFSYQAFENESSSIMFGYNFSQSNHSHLESFDSQNHMLYASANHSFTNRLMGRLDTFTTRSRLDHDGFANTWSVRPNLFYTFGDRVGVSRAYFDVEATKYKDDPVFSSLEQSGKTYSVGLEHYISIPFWFFPNAWASIGSESSETFTRADRDVLGFSGAFDNTRTQAAVNAHLPLPWKISSEVGLTFAWERYHHANLVDALNSFNVPKRRQDRIVEPTIALVRPINDWLDVEVRWFGRYQYSNVGVYKYNRHIFGLYFKADTQ